MSPKGGRRPRDRATGIIRGLRAALESLPSEQDKRQLVATLDQLRSFIDELRESIVMVPTGDSMVGARAALDELERVYVKATSSPWLAATMGIAPKRKSGAKPLSEDEKREGERRAKELEALTTDQIESKLLNENLYSGAHLRAVAQAFGIRSTKGYSRESLAHHIAMKVANSRGYRALRGEGN